MKHLKILEIGPRRHPRSGREKLHFLNRFQSDVHDRWIDKYRERRSRCCWAQDQLEKRTDDHDGQQCDTQFTGLSSRHLPGDLDAITKPNDRAYGYGPCCV